MISSQTVVEKENQAEERVFVQSTPYFVAEAGTNHAQVTLLPGVVVAKDWIEKLDAALAKKHGRNNPDFSWDKSSRREPRKWWPKFFGHTGRVSLERFIDMICEVAEVIALPPLPMTVIQGTSLDHPEFVIHWEGDVGEPTWPEELKRKYDISLNPDERTATFILRQITQEDIQLAQEALHWEVKT